MGQTRELGHLFARSMPVDYWNLPHIPALPTGACLYFQEPDLAFAHLTTVCLRLGDPPTFPAQLTIGDPSVSSGERNQLAMALVRPGKGACLMRLQYTYNSVAG